MHVLLALCVTHTTTKTQSVLPIHSVSPIDRHGLLNSLTETVESFPSFAFLLAYFFLLFLSRLARGYIPLSSPHSQRTQHNAFNLSLLCNTGLRPKLVPKLQSFGIYTNKEIAGYAVVTHWPQNLRGLTQQYIHLSPSSCLKLVSPQCVPWRHSGFWRLQYQMTRPFQKMYTVREREHEELSTAFSLLLTWQSCLGNPGGEKEVLDTTNCLYTLRRYLF